MKVDGINPAMAHKIELTKLVQQETIKQQQLKVIKERQTEIERMRPQDLDKGQNIDKMV
jgi:DNA-binding Xre family transcriptional regulator